MIRPADNAKEPGCCLLNELKFVKLVAIHETEKATRVVQRVGDKGIY